MKSNSTGRAMARARSLMKTKAPLSTPTSSGGRPGVVVGDLLAELGDPGLRARPRRRRPRPRCGVVELRRRRGVPSTPHRSARRRGPGQPGALEAEAPGGAGDPAAAADVGGPGARPGRRPAPARRWRRRAGGSQPAASQRRHGPAGQGDGRGGQGPGVGGVEGGGQAVEQLGLVAQERRPGGPARRRRRARRCRRAGAAARGGPGCGGGRGRRWTGRRPASGRRPRHSARVSGRRRPRSGCRGPGAMPARPSRPAPRSRLSSTVSAWSSAVWPVRTSAGSTA